MDTAHLPRRGLIAGLALAAAAAPGSALAKVAAKPAPAATATLLASDFGVVPGKIGDQSAAVQAALNAAHDQGRPLLLPPGHVFVQNLEFPSGARIIGTPGQSVLFAWQDNPVGKALLANDLWLEGITFSAVPSGGMSEEGGLLLVQDSVGVRISGCQFLIGPSTGLDMENSAVTVENSSFDQLDVAIFSRNGRGVSVRGNRITACGNGGILVWRATPGPDGSIISGNHISGVSAKGGGSGQNGNGINIYRADNVIVSDNVIDDCDFSAVRANTARNVAIRGNTCTNLREVAIYAEFAFSGAVIANNIVDGAAAGISMTNLDKGGQLAACTGNIVRNIAASSPTNPDAATYGIYAEADTAITGNTVSTVPGIGIAAGYGAYLRNVLIANNVVSHVKTGIAVSVADGAGPVRIAGNMISAASEHAIAGMKWDEVASPDLAVDASRFSGVSVDGNVVSS